MKNPFAAIKNRFSKKEDENIFITEANNYEEREKQRTCLHEAARWAVADSLYDVKKGKCAGRIHIDYGDHEKFHEALIEAFKEEDPDTTKIDKLWDRKKFEDCKKAFKEACKEDFKEKNLDAKMEDVWLYSHEDFNFFVYEYLQILIAGGLCEFLYDNINVNDFRFETNFEIADLPIEYHESCNMQKFNKIANHFRFDDDMKRNIFRKTISKIQNNKNQIKEIERRLIDGKAVF